MRTYDWSLHLIDSGGPRVSLHLTEVAYSDAGRAVPERLLHNYFLRKDLSAEVDKFLELLLERYEAQLFAERAVPLLDWSNGAMPTPEVEASGAGTTRPSHDQQGQYQA